MNVISAVMLIVVILDTMIVFVVSLAQWKKRLSGKWEEMNMMEKIKPVVTSSFLSPRMVWDSKLRKHHTELYQRLNTRTLGFYEIYGKNVSLIGIPVLFLLFWVLVVLESIK